jgi:hypothetical protein
MEYETPEVLASFDAADLLGDAFAQSNCGSGLPIS